MPNAYAQLLISVNGGATQTGGLTLSGGEVLQLSGAQPGYWDHGQFEIYAWPEGWTAPGGWTLQTTSEGSKYIFYSVGGSVPPAITLPLPATRWGKWLARLVVNDGLNNGKPDPTLVDEATGWQTLGLTGLRGFAALEEQQFGGVRAWAGELDKNFHAMETAILSGVDVTADFGFQGSGLITLSVTDANYTVSTDEWAHRYLVISGTTTATHNMILTSPMAGERVFVNATANDWIIKYASGLDVVLAPGSYAMVYGSSSTVVRVATPAVEGSIVVSVGDATHTVTDTEWQHWLIALTGTCTAPQSLVVNAAMIGARAVGNFTGQTWTVTYGSGLTVDVPNNGVTFLYGNGTNIIKIGGSAATVPVETAAAGVADVDSLVSSDVSQQEWEPFLGGTSPFLETGAVSTALDATVLNFANASGTFVRETAFAPPAGVTQIAFEVDAELAPGVGSSTISIQIRSIDGVTLIASHTCVLTGTMTTYTTGSVSVTPGTFYLARILMGASPASNPASAAIDRVKIRPITASDVFYTSGFIRYAALQRLLWDNNRDGLSLGGTVHSVPYRRQSGMCRQVFRTTATRIGVQLFNVLKYFMTTAFPSAPEVSQAIVSVDGKPIATVIGAAGVHDVQIIDLPAGNKLVEVFSSTQFAINGTPENLGSLLLSVLVPTEHAIQAAAPPKENERILVYSDSKMAGFYALIPNLGGMIGRMRRQMPSTSVLCEASAGRRFYDDNLTDAGMGALVARFAQCDPTKIIVSIGRNDWANSTITVGEYQHRLGRLLDSFHEARPECSVYCVSTWPETLELANGNGETLQDWRDAMQNAASDRAAWVTFLDGTAVPGYSSSTTNADGIHPNDAGYALITQWIIPLLVPTSALALAVARFGYADEEVGRYLIFEAGVNADQAGVLISQHQRTDGADGAAGNTLKLRGQKSLPASNQQAGPLVLYGGTPGSGPSPGARPGYVVLGDESQEGVVWIAGDPFGAGLVAGVYNLGAAYNRFAVDYGGVQFGSNGVVTTIQPAKITNATTANTVLNTYTPLRPLSGTAVFNFTVKVKGLQGSDFVCYQHTWTFSITSGGVITPATGTQPSATYLGGSATAGSAAAINFNVNSGKIETRGTPWTASNTTWALTTEQDQVVA